MKIFITKFLKQFFCLMVLVSIPVNAEERIQIQHQVLENYQLRTFFGFYDSDNQLINDIDQENIYIKYGNRSGRVSDLSKFSSERFGTAYLFLIDISKSVSSDNFEKIINSIETWTSTLNIGDSIAVLTFGESVNLVQDFTFDKSRVSQSLSNIKRTDMLTRYYDALDISNKIITRNDPNLPYRRVVITLTDGLNDVSEGEVSPEIAEVMEPLIKAKVPYFTIGFAQRMTLAKSKAIQSMQDLSKKTGGIFFDANRIGIEDAFKRSKRSIEDVYMITSSCSRCNYADEVINFNIELNYDDQIFSASRELQLLSPTSPATYEEEIQPNNLFETTKNFIFKYLYLILLIIIVIILSAYYLFKKPPLNKNQKKQDEVFAEDVNDDDFDDKDMHLSLSDNHPYFVSLELFKSSNKEKFKATFDNSLSIGRSTKNDLCITNFNDISGVHCKITRVDNGFAIQDSESTNGTFLNGAQVFNPCPLSSGDELKLGSNLFKVFIGKN